MSEPHPAEGSEKISDRDLLAHVVTKVGEIAAAMKNVVRDVEGLMYYWTEDGELRLRDHVADADTNTSPPANCDAHAWAVRGQLIALQEYLEQLQTKEHP